MRTALDVPFQVRMPEPLRSHTTDPLLLITYLPADVAAMCASPAPRLSLPWVSPAGVWPGWRLDWTPAHLSGTAQEKVYRRCLAAASELLLRTLVSSTLSRQD
jgi:hypothetical protein